MFLLIGSMVNSLSRPNTPAPAMGKTRPASCLADRIALAFIWLVTGRTS